MKKFLCWARPRTKAIAAAVGALLGWAVAQGVKLPPGWEVGIPAAVAAGITYWAPKNEECG